MGKDAPKPPDPYKVADAQSKANIATAQEQARLGMTGQINPWGSVEWVEDPSSPSGYRQVMNLSPEQQALMGGQQDLQASALDAAGGVIGNPFDLDAARGLELSDMQRTFLDPEWASRQGELENSLYNRGIQPGSEAWERETRQFGNQRSSAYDRMYLDAWSQANDAALKERNLPLSDLALVYGLPQTEMPQFQSTPQPGVAPTDVSGNVWNAYNAQAKQASDQMGGLFGLGSSLLGGWASAGFPMLSDRRAKKNIKRIGTDPRGWGVYQYRYRGADETDDTWKLGFMADEVERFRPDAVITSASTGIKMVNYEALAV